MQKTIQNSFTFFIINKSIPAKSAMKILPLASSKSISTKRLKDFMFRKLSIYIKKPRLFLHDLKYVERLLNYLHRF